MSKSNVVSLHDKREEVRAQGEFLELIDADIKANPGRIQPIPRSLLTEISEIRARAEENRRRELLEG
jgi:hypothetical protein